MPAPYLSLAVQQMPVGDLVWTYRLRDEGAAPWGTKVDEGIEDGPGTLAFEETTPIKDLHAFMQATGRRACAYTYRSVGRDAFCAFYGIIGDSWVFRFFFSGGGDDVDPAPLRVSDFAIVLEVARWPGMTLRLIQAGWTAGVDGYPSHLDFPEVISETGDLWLLDDNSLGLTYVDAGGDLYYRLGELRFNIAGWGAPVLIRAARNITHCLRLEPSNNVFVVCADGAGNLKLNILQYAGGAVYNILAEIDMGFVAMTTGGLWQTEAGAVKLAYLDAAGDVQVIESDLSGAVWA